MGGNSTDLEEKDTTTTGSGETAEARVTGPTAMTDIEVGTEVHAGFKGIHLTPHIPKTDRDTSASIRPTATEVGWYEYRSWGNIWRCITIKFGVVGQNAGYKKFYK